MVGFAWHPGIGRIGRAGSSDRSSRMEGGDQACGRVLISSVERATPGSSSRSRRGVCVLRGDGAAVVFGQYTAGDLPRLPVPRTDRDGPPLLLVGRWPGKRHERLRQQQTMSAPVRRRLQAVRLALCKSERHSDRERPGVASSAAAVLPEEPSSATALLPAEPVLSADDLALWEDRGWMVVKGAVAKEDCAAVVTQICAAMGMSENDPASWHRRGGPAGLGEDGEVIWDADKATPIHHGVPMHNTQAQWNIRTAPRVHAAFAQIYGTSRLWCMPNGVVTLKPPWRENRRLFKHVCHAGMKPWFGLGDALPMHWDVSPEQMVDGGYGGTFDATPEPGFPFPTSQYRPAGCIGFLMLNDRTEFGGQTAVVPKFHRYFNKWSGSHAAQPEIERMKRPESRNHPEMSQVLRSMDEVFEERDGPAEVVVPAGKAGDLVIIDSYLCHGSGRNTMTTPRFTMWVTSSPVPADPTEREQQREKRVEGFLEQSGWKPPDERGKLPKLTPLGQRVAGLKQWDE